MWLVVPLLLLSGCDAALIDPAGQVGQGLRSLIFTAFALMMIVVIPVIIMTILFAWRYRQTNLAAKYTPNWEHSTIIEVFVWFIPLVIIVFLAIITWQTSHQYDPHNPNSVTENPEEVMEIQAVSLDWKWLFIYPDLNIATVNEVAFPVDQPVRFQVTSGTVMNSFMIPTLGSQIYAMAGMDNDVYLESDREGVFRGRSTNYSGRGFSQMLFDARVTSEQEFQQWVQQVRQSPDTLTYPQEYEALAEPTVAHPVEYFSQIAPHLYQDILNRFRGGPSDGNHGNHGREQNHSSDQAHAMSAQAAE